MRCVEKAPSTECSSTFDYCMLTFDYYYDDYDMIFVYERERDANFECDGCYQRWWLRFCVQATNSCDFSSHFSLPITLHFKYVCESHCSRLKCRPLKLTVGKPVICDVGIVLDTESIPMVIILYSYGYYRSYI